MAETLNVIVDRVLYQDPKEPHEWHVLLTDMGKCVGGMKWRPEPKERLTLTGTWKAYRGERNFNFAAAVPNVPVNPKDLLRYAVERTTGIGPSMEAAIWEAYGEHWQDIEPGTIKGMTQARHDALRETIRTLNTEREKSQAIGWLMGQGASDRMAMAAWDEWEMDMIGLVHNNCYRLADLPHFAFSHVDKDIRRNFGIEDDDPRRIRSAIIYALRSLTSGGSTVIDWIMLRDECGRLLGARHAQMVSDLTSDMFQEGALVGFTGSRSIALKPDYDNEILILEWANGL